MAWQPEKSSIQHERMAHQTSTVKTLNGKHIFGILGAVLWWAMIMASALAAAAHEPVQPPQPGGQKSPPDSPKPAQPKQNEDTVGKSKIEKETGTVNDRILDVLPNYV